MSIFADQILVHLHVATSLSAHYSSVKFITNIHMSFRTLYVMKAMCFRPSLLRAKMLQVHKIVCSRDYKLQIQWWHRKHSSIQLTSYTGYMLSVLHKIPGIPWLAERVSGHEHGLWPPLGPGTPHCRGFEITLRHTNLGRTPLDDWSVRRREL